MVQAVTSSIQMQPDSTALVICDDPLMVLSQEFPIDTKSRDSIQLDASHLTE